MTASWVFFIGMLSTTAVWFVFGAPAYKRKYGRQGK